MPNPMNVTTKVPVSLARRLGVLVAATLLAGACAAQQSASAPLAKPDDLEGTRWKLPYSEGGIDGRTIEFKRGTSGYEGVLTVVGRKLDGKVGARQGLVLMELVPTEQKNSFKGFERLPGQELSEVLCSVSSDGRAMKCNGESTAWERQL
jgi:hypothetical protein